MVPRQEPSNTNHHHVMDRPQFVTIYPLRLFTGVVIHCHEYDTWWLAAFGDRHRAVPVRIVVQVTPNCLIDPREYWGRIFRSCLEPEFGDLCAWLHIGSLPEHYAVTRPELGFARVCNDKVDEESLGSIFACLEYAASIVPFPKGLWVGGTQITAESAVAVGQVAVGQVAVGQVAVGQVSTMSPYETFVTPREADRGLAAHGWGCDGEYRKMTDIL